MRWRILGNYASHVALVLSLSLSLFFFLKEGAGLSGQEQSSGCITAQETPTQTLFLCNSTARAACGRRHFSILPTPPREDNSHTPETSCVAGLQKDSPAFIFYHSAPSLLFGLLVHLTAIWFFNLVTISLPALEFTPPCPFWFLYSLFSPWNSLSSWLILRTHIWKQVLWKCTSQVKVRARSRALPHAVNVTS